MVITLLTLLFQSIVLVFALCELSNKISSQFDDLSDIIYRSVWYRCSLNVQRLLPTILIATQESFELSGYGNVPYNRGTFIDVSYSS